MLPLRFAILFLALLLHVASAGAANPNGSVRFLDSSKEGGTSQAVIVRDVSLAHTAQLLPLDDRGRLVGEGQPARQVEKVLDNLALALGEVHSGFDQLIKVNVYAVGEDVIEEVQKAFGRRFTAAKPAVSFVVGGLPSAGARVALDAVAIVGNESGPRVKRLVAGRLHDTGLSHVAVLPAGARVYISGQAEKGEDLAQATRRTLESLRKTLKHLGRADADVVQVKAFLNPMSGADAVRKEVAKFFEGPSAPPLVLVEWRSTLPIEIELIASAGPERPGEALEFVTPPGMQASPVFSRVARINHGPTIYLAGLYGSKNQDAKAEVQDIFAQMQTLLTKSGSDLQHLAKATYYVSTEEASRQLNELRPHYYDPRRPPAASKAMVPAVGRADRSLTLDMIAVGSPPKP
jgi:enamine deaminase RidA (YjgF/YER057c/UK114 family)